MFGLEKNPKANFEMDLEKDLKKILLKHVG